MPRASNGTCTLAEDAFVTNTTIVSADMNSDLSDIITMLTDSLSVSGKGGMTAALDMNSHKINELTAGTAGTDAVNLTQMNAAIAASGTSGTPVGKTAAYTIVNGDKGKTFYFSGAAYYTVTVGAASGFDADFQVRIINSDSRGKLIAINGLTSFILYPGQTIEMLNEASTWAYTPSRQRFISPGLTVQVNSGGSNSNDGLAAGASGAFQTIQFAWNFIVGSVDTVKSDPTIQLAVATYTIANVVLSGQPAGSYIVNINGSTSTPTNYVLSVTAAAQGFQIVDYATVTFTGVEFAGGGGSTICYLHQHSIADFGTACYFGGNATGVTVNCEDTGKAQTTGDVTIDGSAAYFVVLTSGGVFLFGNVTHSMPNALAFTAFIAASGSGASANFGTTAAFTGGGAGAGSTGLKYDASLNATIIRNGRTIPCATAGTTATGAQAT